ncbi:MAG: cob(I)yrinic acid a,c-diamide adenosyltransferase [Desulfarculaceae bacterium]|nr:cob(I)yrinic acid a,c-diamide adenosyltransferase [Desulfarculaceae bacterium]MCF8072985.1 cob(I)yrinic acid a,c-diamide adenosyltransferase [Desulfarculaceae bacterium]MCF8100719.1 cob(I)yrinic acid a,c-diamide adenosyltransferase [Desulfarculaceae bacterium]MCF8115457.1 cob(I)yrinic acid a,c-diamide adenosyltransferase [Desulfarculaceae bacterium]
MDETKGLVMVNTGRGKGKSTAAFGLAVRAAGHGWRTLIIQFVKSGQGYGEVKGLGFLPGVELRATGLGLIGDHDDLAPHREAARNGWDMAVAEVTGGDWDLVILDEINVAMRRGFVGPEEVAGLIKAKPPRMHLVLTGRSCPPEIQELADMVTVMEPKRHHAQAGVPAQAGVEF